MRIIVTPLDIHPRTPAVEPFWDEGRPFTGRSQLVVEPGRVVVDGSVVLFFDKDDEAYAESFVPHNWEDLTGHAWTGFSVEVEP